MDIPKIDLVNGSTIQLIAALSLPGSRISEEFSVRLST